MATFERGRTTRGDPEVDITSRTEGRIDATFTVDAFPGQHFKGRIAQVRNAAQTVQNVVTYTAVIDVDNPDLRLRPGMTANVTIVTAEKADALAAPNAALRFKPPQAQAGGGASARERRQAPPGGPGSPRRAAASGSAAANASAAPSASAAAGAPSSEDVGEEKTVYVLEGTAAKPVRLRVGITDGTYTEIVGGPLREGDAVIVDGAGGPATTSAPTGNRPPRMF